jgi:hypothetical protein
MKPLLLIVLLLLANTVAAAELTPEQRAQFAKDNYACLLEYRTSAPVIQAPPGSSAEAVILQGKIELMREERYVRACLESKGWTFPARNAESTK